MSAAVYTPHINAQQLLWQRVFDTGVATDPCGNIIVVGTTIPQKIQPPNREDFLIVKYNPSGDTVWTQRYHQTFADNAYGVATDKAGNIIVVGSIYNDSTNADIHIVKYNPVGNILWTRTYSNGKNVGEFGYGVSIDSKNNIIITGKAYYNWGDYITIKYDSSGNLLWMRTYDAGWEDYAQDVAVDDSDNVIVTGYSDSNINWDWCTIKYSPDGDILWVRLHDVALDDKADGVTCDKDGNVIVVGRLGQSPTKYAAIVKYSPAGDTLWTKLFVRPVPIDGLMNFKDVATDERENIYLVGAYVLWDNGRGWTDYYVAKCKPQGDTVWTFRYDYDHVDKASGIALDRFGNIVVTGTTNRGPGAYEENYLTIKIKDITNMFEDNSSFPKEFILYPNFPNPFNSMTTIEFAVPGTLHVVLKVYNLLGQEIKTLMDEGKGPGRYCIKWDASRYTSGIYIARLTAGNYVASQKLLLIK